ncbi:MAG: class I SAM-dependent methyltransferase [Gemmataceae bacterium]
MPAYDPLQRAFHRAFERELTRAVGGLPLPPGGRALDVPCGDGFYTRRLARRAGHAVGIDADEAYLRVARRRGGAVSYRRGDVYALPCPDAGFDLALCAMSFISLDDPVRALGELRRVLAPGGVVAVLESDEYHHVLLPWPVDLEVEVQRALRDRAGSRYSPARKVNRMLREAGFAAPRKVTHAADRQAPFPAELVEFLKRHLAFLKGLVGPGLTAAERRRFDHFADPDGEGSLFRRPDAELTCLTALYRAQRPAQPGTPD